MNEMVGWRRAWINSAPRRKAGSPRAFWLEISPSISPFDDPPPFQPKARNYEAPMLHITVCILPPRKIIRPVPLTDGFPKTFVISWKPCRRKWESCADVPVASRGRSLWRFLPCEREQKKMSRKYQVESKEGARTITACPCTRNEKSILPLNEKDDRWGKELCSPSISLALRFSHR